MNLLKKILLEYAVLIEKDSEASQQAKAMGLTHIGFGMWQNAAGDVTHKTVDGQLVPIQQQAKVPQDTSWTKQHLPSDDPSQDVPPQNEPEDEPEAQDGIDNLEGPAKLLAIDAQQVNDTFRSTEESLKKKDKERQKYVLNGISQLQKLYGKSSWVKRARASGDQLELIGPNGTVEKKSAGEWAEMFIEMKTNKNVGLGSDESRAGEAAIVHGINEVLNEYKKNPDKFKLSRVMGGLRTEFSSVAKKRGAKLTSSWADTALSTIESMIEDYGLDNIEFASWDTKEGNEIVGSEGHGTSADMFLKLTNGKTVGVSLKKDYNVFFMNGGFNTILENILKDLSPEEAASISDKISLDSYFKQRTDHFISLAKNKKFKSEALRMAQSCVDGGECPLGNSDIRRIQKGFLDSAFDKISSGDGDNLTVDEMKILARVASNSNNANAQQQIEGIRNLSNKTLEEVFTVAVQNEQFGDNLKDKVVKGLHLTDTLGVGLINLDEFVTYFGNERFDNKAVLKYFLTDKNDIQQLQRAIRSDNKETIDKFFRDRIHLTFDQKSGKGQINFRRSNDDIDGQPKYMSLAFCNLRERGVGARPTFEMGVSQELQYVLKYGPNFDAWPKRARTAWTQRQKRKGQIEDDVEATPRWSDPLVGQTKELMRSLIVRELERIHAN